MQKDWLLARPSGDCFICAPRPSVASKRRWLCLCECGIERIVYEYNLLDGNTQSCGCLHKAIVSKHGDYQSPEYGIWRQMIRRCSNPNEKNYHNYGGRGISVCQRWQGANGYSNFLADVGRKPAGRSLDRHPNKNGDYEPSNVRWATQKEQCRNTRRNRLLSFNGKTKCLTEWAETLNLGIATIRWRLQRGWPVDRVLAPIQKGRS